MRLLRSMRFALVLGGLSVALSAGALLIWSAAALDDAPFHFPLAERLIEAPAPLIFAAVGLFVTVRLRGHPVGAALTIASLGYNGFIFCQAYAEYALAPGSPSLPGAELAATLFSEVWIVMIGGFLLLILLFPGGNFPSRRWAILTGACWLLAAVYLLVYPLLTAGLNPPFADSRSPLALESLEPFAWTRALPFVLASPMQLAVAAASVNLVLRFIRSRGLERAQFRWIGFAAVASVITTVLSATPLSVTTQGMQVLSFTLLPVSVGIAVTRYRLYDIDRIISRTLTYGALTLGLGLVYIGLVVGLQRLLEPLSGGSDLAIVTTTLAVAALFLPARRRVQHLVDRRFNRRAYDTQAAIAVLSVRLREQIDLDTLRAEVVAVLDDTMQPAHVSMWLRRAG